MFDFQMYRCTVEVNCENSTVIEQTTILFGQYSIQFRLRVRIVNVYIIRKSKGHKKVKCRILKVNIRYWGKIT
jgi:hypothetical protein